MKLALPVANGLLCMHFGHCQEFNFFEIDEQGVITGSETKTPPPHEPGVLPSWLNENEVTTVIAGGMGMRAQELLKEAGVKVITGAPAISPKEIVNAFLANNLKTGDNACDH
ncbi:NifB/NifX family molybdenum-iron cluster-binding protein [Lentisphaerota bacterium ZTH]|nr:NifB/NifX family molybdenum-iron cluster-binding protein [Lentisphaerota bacterium]WET05121.1 NifB/NifX family molybdenum-iron cluster-binding protein [Lentisphaerota bacterium ZTH]